MMVVNPYVFGHAQRCPNYSTVTLQFTSQPYTPPAGDAVMLQFLPCPYVPPTVT